MRRRTGGARGAPAAAPPDGGDLLSTDDVVKRARVGARLYTLRGVVSRVISIGANFVLIALVSPVDFGLYAVVRGVMGITQYAIELGFPHAMVRQRLEPTREQYAGLAGLQGVIGLAIVALAVLGREPLLRVVHIEPRWYPWLLGAMATHLVRPLGSGARVRLERSLRYERLAAVEVSSVLLQNVGLLVFALAGQFTLGVFLVFGAMTLHSNLWLYLTSRGPTPSLRLASLRPLLRPMAGYTAAAWTVVAYENMTPILIANLFGLPVAGIYAFAIRLGQLLNVTFDGLRHAAMPAAARLAHDAAGLRRIATYNLGMAAGLAIPLSVLMFIGLPVVGLIWPRWAGGVTMAQVFVLCYGVAGTIGAMAEPVAVAVRGSVGALIEPLLSTLLLWLGLVLLWWMGRPEIGWAIPPMLLGPAAVLLAYTPRETRPAWTPALSRLALLLVGAVALHGLSLALGLPLPARMALVATTVLLWLWAEPTVRELPARLRQRGAGPLEERA